MVQIEADPREKADADLDDAAPGKARDADLELLFRHVTEITGHASRLAQLRVARWKVRATWAVSAVLLGLIVVVVAIATGLAGVWLVFRGLPATLTELLGGRAGLADLLSGLILLAGIGSFVLAARSWSERRILRDLEEHDEAEEPPD
ncbi:MAG: hypothetical protein NTY35_02825 [Planctomycetota bacterium]|nr:hypothetical protein [Planctomycetota bacterium]